MCALYKIEVRSDFNAAHNLRGYQGRCERLHGHNWRVEAQVSCAKLNKLGMVCDFREIKRKLEGVLQGLDHSYLNRLPYFKKNNPTSEKIAEYIYRRLKQVIKRKGLTLRSVAVRETETACAVFSEEEL